MIGASALAVDGPGHADTCRHHQHALAGVGQASDRAAPLLHDGHNVRWWDHLEARPPPATARPLSAGQHHHLTTLDVPATCFILPAG
jgi:hypothetical protein